MDLGGKTFSVPRSSARKEFINSLNKSISLFYDMKTSLNENDISIDIKHIPNDALDLSSISITYNYCVEQLKSCFNNGNEKFLINYKQLLETNSISKLELDNASKIIQKYSQEMNMLQENNKILKNIIAKLNKKKKKKEYNRLKRTYIILKQISRKYKKTLVKNDNITPKTLNYILSMQNNRGIIFKLNNIKYKIEEMINIYCMNKRIQSQRQGFLIEYVYSLKSLKNYFSRKYRIRKIFNCIKKGAKGISESIKKIEKFFQNIKKNIKSLKSKAIDSFDRNFTYSNLKSFFENIKYQINDIYSNHEISKLKNIKNMINSALKSNRMPESENEKNIFSCLICIKMINYLFAILNVKDISDINILSKIKFKKMMDLKSTFDVFSTIVTIVSIITTIASYILPLIGFTGIAIFASFITIHKL